MKISFIIPAVNEEKFIARAIDSIKSQDTELFSIGVSSVLSEIDVIVVCNGTTDNTESVARGAGATVIVQPAGIGVSRARNIGARLAMSNENPSDILIFLDADSYISKNTVAEILKLYTEGSYGTVLGKPDKSSFIYNFFFAVKNFVHILGFYKGALGGLMFFDKKLFESIGGYNPNMSLDEIYDISLKARERGGKYILVKSAYAFTSMRRFEKYGAIHMLLLWLKIRFNYLVKKQEKNQTKITTDYQVMKD